MTTETMTTARVFARCTDRGEPRCLCSTDPLVDEGDGVLACQRPACGRRWLEPPERLFRRVATLSRQVRELQEQLELLNARVRRAGS